MTGYIYDVGIVVAAAQSEGSRILTNVFLK